MRPFSLNRFIAPSLMVVSHSVKSCCSSGIARTSGAIRSLQSGGLARLVQKSQYDWHVSHSGSTAHSNGHTTCLEDLGLSCSRRQTLLHVDQDAWFAVGGDRNAEDD